MAEKEKILIYPYDIQFTPILRHKRLLKDYEIMELISPNGWGMTGRDAGVADYGGVTGIIVENDFQAALVGCDTIIINESAVSLDFKTMIQPKIEEAIKKRKNVLCTMSINEESYKYLLEQSKQEGTYLKVFENTFIEPECKVEYIHKINTPIIFVMGVAERTQKFEIQLVLRENLLQKGYKVSQIGSRNYCEILGFHSMPGFMYNNGIPDYQKIILFNHYVKWLEMNEAPDIIIIGIPGGIMPLNEEFTNKFGLMAYEISRAVVPDATILSVLYDHYQSKYFKELNPFIKFRLSGEVDCYNLSNVKFDWGNSRQTGSMTYVTIDSKIVDEQKKKFHLLDTPIFNVFNSDDAKQMTEYLIDRLAEYGEIKSI